MVKGRSLVVSLGDYQPEDFVDAIDKANLNALISLVIEKDDLKDLQENIDALAEEEEAGLMVLVIGEDYDYLNDVFETLSPVLKELDPSIYLLTAGDTEKMEFYEGALTEALDVKGWDKLAKKDKVNLVMCNNDEEEIEFETIASNITKLFGVLEEGDEEESTEEEPAAEEEATEDTSEEDTSTEEASTEEAEEEEDAESCDNGHFGNYDKKNTDCRECKQRKKCRKITYAKAKDDAGEKPEKEDPPKDKKDTKKDKKEKESTKKKTAAEDRDDKGVDHIKDKITDTKKRIEEARKKSPKDRTVKVKHEAEEEPVEVKVLALLDAMDNLLDVIQE